MTPFFWLIAAARCSWLPFDYRWRGAGPWGEALAKKAPPGQTLFFHFLFFGAVLKVSKIFSGPVLLDPPF